MLFAEESKAALSGPPASLFLHGLTAPAAVYQFEWILFSLTVGTVFVAGSIAAARAAIERARPDANAPAGASVAGVIGAILACFGVAGAAGHAIFVSVSNDERWAPDLDVVTVTWLAVIAVGLLLPRLAEFSFGGVSFKLAEVVAKKRETDDILTSESELTQQWIEATTALLAHFERASVTSDDAVRTLLSFFGLRAFEALQWLGADGELRRLSVWIYDRDDDELVFFFSNEIHDKATRTHRFRSGVGLAGYSYANHSMWNVPNAANVPVYQTIVSNHRYKGLLCLPIDYGPFAVGTLIVDREREEAFDPRDVNLMQALASIFGAALGSASTQARITAPDP